MVDIPVVIPAMGLARELEVPAGRAALFTVPSPLVDSESVAPVLVGQAPHEAPDPNRARWRELVKMIVTLGAGGRVARVGLHFTVSAFVQVLTSRVVVVSLHFLVVLEHIVEARHEALTPATAPLLRPPVRKLGQVGLDRFFVVGRIVRIVRVTTIFAIRIVIRLVKPTAWRAREVRLRERTVRQQGQRRCKISHVRFLSKL